MADHSDGREDGLAWLDSYSDDAAPREVPPVIEDEDLLYATPDDFEAMSHENGNVWWWQSDLAAMLGYKSTKSFGKAVNKAIAAFAALGVEIPENFQYRDRTMEDGSVRKDCRLSRFACYLAAMNADARKPEVARAQAYFATLAEVAREYMLETENVERLLIREEVTDHEKALASTAKTAGVDNRKYGLFQNAGYRGLYNRNLKELKAIKGVPTKRSLLDFMGKEELAANLFRITQTEAQIRGEGVYGQKALEKTAHRVGREVRTAIEQIGGTMPERLAPSEDIKKVRTGLKKAGRELGKIDKKKLAEPKKVSEEGSHDPDGDS